MDVVVRVDVRVALAADRVKVVDRAAKAADHDDQVAKVVDDPSDRKVAGNDRNDRAATMPESDSSQ